MSPRAGVRSANILPPPMSACWPLRWELSTTPAPSSTAATPARIPACLPVMMRLPCAAWPWHDGAAGATSPRRFPGWRPAPAPRRFDELHAHPQRLDVELESRLDGAQSLADVALLLLEALDFTRLVGREQCLAAAGFGRLQLAQRFFGLVEFRFELLLFGAELRVGIAAQGLDAIEGARIRSPAADADEIVAAARGCRACSTPARRCWRTAAQMVWPKKLRCCTHMKSASRSESAIRTTLSGLADALSASGAAVTPAGGPLAKALVAFPETRAATTNSPLGLNPSRRVAGSLIMAKRCVGSRPACLLVWISGSNLSLIRRGASNHPRSPC